MGVGWGNTGGNLRIISLFFVFGFRLSSISLYFSIVCTPVWNAIFAALRFTF